MKIIYILICSTFLCCLSYGQISDYSTRSEKMGNELKKPNNKIDEHQVNSYYLKEISNILNEWDNVKNHLEKGHPMYIKYSKRYYESKAAKWITKFDHALSALADHSSYNYWLDLFFPEDFPYYEATDEMIYEMSFNYITSWITYLYRICYWSDVESFKVIINEIENGRMEAVVENLRNIYQTN